MKAGQAAAVVVATALLEGTKKKGKRARGGEIDARMLSAGN